MLGPTISTQQEHLTFCFNTIDVNSELFIVIYYSLC